MATTPPPVKLRERLWSEEVALANASDDVSLVPPKDPAYQFSNGRKFVVDEHYKGAANG